MLRSLFWWLLGSNISQGISIGPLLPDVILTTDTSSEGQGAHCLNLIILLTLYDVWMSRKLQISVLELRGICYALVSFAALLSGKIVQIQMDNITAVDYNNEQVALDQ